MSDLFSEDPQFRRAQYTKLSDNTKEWPQEIGSMAMEQIPRDLELSVTIVFQKIDDTKGYAIGTAIASNRDGTSSIGIPIVVKSWHIAPLDLFFKEGRMFPLTIENLAKAFYAPSLGATVATARPLPNMADESHMDTRMPPMGGKYSYSSPTSSMLSAISGTLGADDITAFHSAVSTQPGVLAGFQKRGMFDHICKWASEKPAATEQDDENLGHANGVFTVKKDGPNKYRVWANTDGVFDPVLITTDRQSLRHILDLRRAELWDYDQDPLNSIDRYGEFTVVPPTPVYGNDIDGPTMGGSVALGTRKNPFVFDPLQDERVVRTTDRFGRYAVRDKSGVIAKGWVIPNVVTLDGNTTGLKLFIGRSLSAIQGRIAGIPINDEASVTMLADRPDTGKSGTLVYSDGNRVMATTPFQITSVTVYKGMRSIGTVDYKGVQANLILCPTMEGIVPVTSKDGFGPLMGPKKNYLVSAKMFFVCMPNLTSVSESPDDFKKTASEYLDHAPLRISTANGRYIFRGHHVAKYASVAEAGRAASAARGAVVGPTKAQFFANADRDKSKKAVAASGDGTVKAAFDFNALSHPEASFLLGSWGLGREKIAEALGSAKEHVVLEVHHLRWPDVPSLTKQANLGDLLAEMTGAIKGDIRVLVKCASFLEDADTVDSVLSLGFVNPNNIHRFVLAQPMLEEVSSVMAKMLLASRMGISDIPEEATSSAISQIQRIIGGLNKLKATSASQMKTAMASKQLSRRPTGAAVGAI